MDGKNTLQMGVYVLPQIMVLPSKVGAPSKKGRYSLRRVLTVRVDPKRSRGQFDSLADRHQFSALGRLMLPKERARIV